METRPLKSEMPFPARGVHTADRNGRGGVNGIENYDRQRGDGVTAAATTTTYSCMRFKLLVVLSQRNCISVTAPWIIVTHTHGTLSSLPFSTYDSPIGRTIIKTTPSSLLSSKGGGRF